MKRLTLVLATIAFFAPLSHAQFPLPRRPSDNESAAPFEVYGAASVMKTVDASGTIIVTNPGPNQPINWGPTGGAQGARGGFIWRNQQVGLMTEFGYHRYSSHSGSVSMAPFLVGLRFYSPEGYRTTFFGEVLGGGYRWTVKADKVDFPPGKLNFTHVKGMWSGGGGMDIRLTRHLVWRVFDVRISLVGAQPGPLLNGDASTGFAFRFGDR